MPAATLPIVLQTALSFLATYLASHAVAYGRSGNRQRGMRSDRRNNILAVATAMIRGCCLQHDGVICQFFGNFVRPMSIAEFATLAQICPKTVSRCIGDMKDLGLIECIQIKRKNPKTGQFEVSIGIRRFTKKFWKALGLWDFFQKSCTWAKEHGKRKLVMPFKGVSLKVKNTCTAAKDTVKSVLAGISEEAQRVKYNCDKIREMLRNKNK